MFKHLKSGDNDLERLINLSEYPVKPVLKLLLTDKTTKQNIVFATGSYSHLGARYREESHIDEDLLYGMDAMLIQPRVLKNSAEQADRTKKKAEVMTPAWIVNKMNNHCDEVWFGYPNAFNCEDGERWVTRDEPVAFPQGRSWKKYVDSMRLEITCGEAPYLVSRYDTTTGESIPWEGWRRQDLIRFGKYESLYDGPDKVDESDGHTSLFPIPNDAKTLNQNLKQNDGY